MDTNVPGVKSGKESTVNFEENPAAPENSDVALFKQKMAQIDSTLNTVIGATTPTTEREQTESLIDLSHKLAKDTQPILEQSNGKQAVPIIDKKASLLHSQAEVTLGKTDTSDKDVLAKEASVEGMTRGKGVEFDQSKVPADSHISIDSLKKEAVIPQDNPYIAPTGTPLITHSNTIQSTGVVETHAAMISQQIKDQVIDRILVSTNDLAANKTVKVIINPTVLEGTEVNFQKIGDTLSVQFASRNEGSLNFLQVNQADLQNYLQSGLKQFKDVMVSIKSGGNSAETPEDGRSRNRYDYQSLDDDEQ